MPGSPGSSFAMAWTGQNLKKILVNFILFVTRFEIRGNKSASQVFPSMFLAAVSLETKTGIKNRYMVSRDQLLAKEENEMKLVKVEPNRSGKAWLLLIACLAVLTACGGGDKSAPQGTAPAAAKPEAAQAQPAAAGVKVENIQVAPCALLTQAEVEAAVGRSVAAPFEERMANLAICSYGDPGAPLINGRPFSKIVSLSIFTGSDAKYYAGAAAQAKEIFDMAKKNAGSVQPVNGLGEDAFWDKDWKTLRVVKGKYEVEVAELGDLAVARRLAAKVLERLP